MEEDKLEALDNKEVSDALHTLLHWALKEIIYETQIRQFHIVYNYIEQLEKENEELSEELNSVKEIYYTQRDIDEDFIPKSKIREMIKELEEAKESDFASDKCVERLCNGMIAILKELLE